MKYVSRIKIYLAIQNIAFVSLVLQVVSMYRFIHEQKAYLSTFTHISINFWQVMGFFLDIPLWLQTCICYVFSSAIRFHIMFREGNVWILLFYLNHIKHVSFLFASMVIKYNYSSSSFINKSFIFNIMPICSTYLEHGKCYLY